MLLVILDGWGYSDNSKHNAIAQAKTPTWDNLWRQYPHCLLEASGPAVGLPPGQIGNSEVGHLTMGSGRIPEQDLIRIDAAIATNTLFNNQELTASLARAKQSNAKTHIIALLSDGGVHSHERHVNALIDYLEQNQQPQVHLHAILDGRDTSPKSAEQTINKFKTKVSTMIGRYYAMDRDNRVERTKLALDLIINNSAKHTTTDPLQAIAQSYEQGITDEFLEPTLIKESKITDGDIIICMNFRADRMRQLCHGLEDYAQNAKLYTMCQYDESLAANVLLQPEKLSNVLHDLLAANNIPQLQIAETEKYAHVSYFFNAGAETLGELDKRVMVPSPKVSTYDQAPAMSAIEITKHVCAALAENPEQMIICNFANADMVGHTGNFEATVQAIEVLDQCLNEIYQTLVTVKAEALITADHGNAELMWNEQTGLAHTAHTTNPVPLIYVGDRVARLKDGGLADLAPTIVELLAIRKPSEMLGTSLVDSYNEQI